LHRDFSACSFSSQLKIPNLHCFHCSNSSGLFAQVVKCFVIQSRVIQTNWVAGIGIRNCLNVVGRATEN
jgi:hypothetical protein